MLFSAVASLSGVTESDALQQDRHWASPLMVSAINDAAAPTKAASRGRAAPQNDACRSGVAASGCLDGSAPSVPGPGYDALKYGVPCDGASDMYPRLSELVGTTIPRAGGGMVVLNAPGKTCVFRNSKTIAGSPDVAFSVTNGTNIEYAGTGIILPLRRADIIAMHPATMNAKYTNAPSNDVTTFSYMFADANPADKNNREKMATYSLCDSSDTSMPPSYTHDCVGAQLDSDNPFGAKMTRQWGLTANAIQSVAKGDGQMTAGEFDITLVAGNTAQPKVDQPNSKYGQQVICISGGPNCTTGTYYNKAPGTIGKWNDAITISASAIERNALCLLEVNSAETCQASIDKHGGVHASSVQLKAVAYDALPICSPANAGTVAYVIDARVAPEKWHQPITAGGGANRTLIQCMGAGWLAM